MGIKLVEAGEKARKYIISLKSDGAQVLAGREDKVYKYRRGICKYDKLHILFKGVDVIHQGIEKHSDQRHKPEKISPDDQKHIFDKFYQGDNSHEQEGNGLGLSLVSRIVRICEGSISAGNRPEQGAIFTVLLPVHTK